MKKTFSAIAALFALLFTLCSCMSMEIGVEIRADGTARAYSEMAVKQSALDAMDVSEEDFFEQVEESGDSDGYEGWDREKFSKTIGGEDYTGIRYYKESSLDFLAEEGLSAGEADGLGSEMSFRREGSDLIVHIVFRGSGKDGSSDVESYAQQEMLKAKFRVSAPFEIVETNGVIDEDGSVCWDMMSVLTGKSDVLDMEVRYHVGTDMGLILWIVGGVLLAAAVIAAIVLILRRRPKPLDPAAMTASYHPEAAENAIPTAPIGEGTASPVPATVPETRTEEAVPAGDSAAEKPAEAPRFCSNCGARLKADDTFCSSCGEKLN